MVLEMRFHAVLRLALSSRALELERADHLFPLAIIEPSVVDIFR